MQSAVPTRPVSSRAVEDRDQRLYFKLSLLSAEKTRLQNQLDTLHAKEDATVKRMGQVDRQVEKLRSEVMAVPDDVERRRLGRMSGLRACPEIEIEY